MKRIVALCLVLLLQQSLFADDNKEFRATWVITLEHINSGLSVEQNKVNVRKIFDNHQTANMNAVLWQCRQNGTAYYNSSYEPWGFYAGYTNPGYDPLAYAIEEAHKRGMELHAWMNAFESRDTKAKGTPLDKHPEWICRDRDGNPMINEITLSPGLGAVREYLIKVAMEIVRNYDIDGLHLDYVRWNPYPESGQLAEQSIYFQDPQFSEGFVNEAQTRDFVNNTTAPYQYDIEHLYSGGVPAGFSTWEDWCRWSVTEFVRLLHDSIQVSKPWVRLSAAALGNYNWDSWQGYGTVYQDAALWFNEGYIDQLTPMLYHWTYPYEFYKVLETGGDRSWKPWIQKGISAGRLFSAGPGSYKFAAEKTWSTHPGIVETIRTIPWVDGFQFFSYGSWEDYDYWEEAGTTFFKRKTKIRDTKLIVATTPDAPTIQLLKIDSLNYQINVIPPASMVTNHRYAIYRSPDNNINMDTDEIIDIHFGNSGYSFTDSFAGTQNYDSTYFYAATALDRYWNESNVSNILASDPIPSFAPMVISTSPVEGDSIPINSSIVINFSKTMNTASLVGAISITPNVENDQFVWSTDHKSLTINIKANFQYATDYTLTVASTITDINGKQLDGNGDGIGGDAFVLHFRTEAADVVGPKIVSSYPDFNSYYEDFVVDEVITFLFDEIVNPATVNSSTVSLNQAGNNIQIGYLLTHVNGRTVLSIQSLDTLNRGAECSMALTKDIADTTGNKMNSDITAHFKTSLARYTYEKMIDKFLSTSNWQQPDYSGSTVGIIIPNTVFEMSTAAYLPASPTRQRISALLRYEWDPSSTSFLLRDYCSGDAARAIVFDTTATLQYYVFGDGSHNQFRFCIDEGDGTNWPTHEVSQWVTIDWYGWKLIEWKLNDPNGVGAWIGNGVLDGKAYRIDSFQLTHDNTGAIKGRIYFDNLRIVKKSYETTIANDISSPVISNFRLMQNYPNPFNPTTTVAFDLPKRGPVVLKVYDVLGRTVGALINETLEAGHHEIKFDGAALPSGIYFYRMEFDRRIMSRQMLLLK